MPLLNKIFGVVKHIAQVLITRFNLKRLASYKSVPHIKAFSKTIFNLNTHLGRNCHFNGIVVEGGGKLIIGDNFHSGNNVRVITQNHNFDTGTRLPYDSTYTFKDVIIGDNVWVGTGVTILGGVTIGEGAIIQAGSVVVHDIPICAIAGGHPAKAFSYRDKEHYEELKRLKKYG